MKRKYNVFILLLLLAFASCSFTSKTFSDPNKDKLLVQVITYVLEQGHYNPKEMDDTFSLGVYEDYLQRLDPLKRFFIKADLADFKKFDTQLDDQLKAYDIAFFNLTHERLIKRMEETKAIYKSI
ncbi:MAG: tail-specific protease, partial [Oceanihabitans sp.]